MIEAQVDGTAPDVLSRFLQEKREKVAHNCQWKLGASLREERLFELGLKEQRGEGNKPASCLPRSQHCARYSNSSRKNKTHWGVKKGRQADKEFKA